MIGTRGYFKEGFLMIKLIASDMDGTFLDGNECVPEGSYRAPRVRAVWVGVGTRGGGCTVCI